MSSFHDWMVAAVLNLAGLSLLWVFIGDRVRGRFRDARRCRKCWYDMSHTPGRTCSECGFTARNERQLHRHRRRWRYAFLASFLASAGYALNVAPGVRDRGWVAAVPTTAIIVSLPFLNPNLDAYAWDIGGTKPVPPRTWREKLLDDVLEKRIENDPLASFHQWVLDWVSSFSCDFKIASVDPWPSLRDQIFATVGWKERATLEWNRDFVGVDEIGLSIQTKERWPRDCAVFGRVQIEEARGFGTVRLIGQPRSPTAQSWQRTIFPRPFCGTGLPPSAWRDGLQQIATASTESEIAFDCLVQHESFSSDVWITRWVDDGVVPVKIDIERTGNVHDVVECTSDPKLTVALEQAIRPTISHGYRYQVEGEVYCLWLGPQVFDVLERYQNTTFAFSAQILAHDREIASCQAWYTASRETDGYLHVNPIRADIPLRVSNGGMLESVMDGSVSGSVRIRWDPACALRNFELIKCWRGEFTIPVEATSPHANDEL